MFGPRWIFMKWGTTKWKKKKGKESERTISYVIQRWFCLLISSLSLSAFLLLSLCVDVLYLVFLLPSHRHNICYLRSLAKNRKTRMLRISWPKRVLPQAIQLRWQFRVHIFYLPDAFSPSCLHPFPIYLSMFTENIFSYFKYIWMLFATMNM